MNNEVWYVGVYYLIGPNTLGYKVSVFKADYNQLQYITNHIVMMKGTFSPVEQTKNKTFQGNLKYVACGHVIVCALDSHFKLAERAMNLSTYKTVLSSGDEDGDSGPDFYSD